MNVAIIFAGGVGRRMNSRSTPKQFLLLHEKPIIIHTLNVFQKSKDIDAICVACLESHIDYMRSLCDTFSISKVKWIVPGGATCQESRFNGLRAIKDSCPEDTIVLMHDGVRPNIDASLIHENIAAVCKYRSAISCASATETSAEIDEENNISAVHPREKTVIAKAPQSFYLNDLFDAHLKAIEEDKEFIDSASMMRYYGKTLHTVPCRWDNIKITTPSDFYIFKAILEAEENSQIFGL